MAYKALFFDIDGTLVSFKTHRIPPSAVEAIRQLRQQGVLVIIATGRLMRDIRNLEGLDFDGYMTVNGGCCLTGDGKVLLDRGIPREDLTQLFDRLDRDPFPCSFMTADGIFVNYVDDRVAALAKLVDLPTPKVRNLRQLAAEQTIYQINIYVDQQREMALMPLFPNCVSSRWNDLFADINLRGIDKFSGMECFLKHYGLDWSETMAFGDGGNDVSMIQGAAVGVAMGGACEAAEAIADYVTADVDEDGIAKALRHYQLIQ
ncbi:MAG: Cof-type HAD-IIB family hydrolase [Alistipes sp.]